MTVQAVQATFVATGNSASFTPKGSAYIQGARKFNFSVWGTFVGTVVLERSFDNGATWLQAFLLNTATAISATAPASYILEEPEDLVIYRARCSAFTSGTINYRISE